MVAAGAETKVEDELAVRSAQYWPLVVRGGHGVLDGFGIITCG